LAAMIAGFGRSHAKAVAAVALLSIVFGASAGFSPVIAAQMILWLFIFGTWGIFLGHGSEENRRAWQFLMLWAAAGFLAIANAAGSTLWTYGSALLQRIVPDEVRGRVAAAEMGGMVLTMSSSTWAVGQSLDHGIPARALMAACGLVALVPLAFWASVQAAFPSRTSP